MKFGKTITSNQVPEWSHHYLNYKDLKKQIKEIVKIQESLPEDKLDNIEVKKALASFFFAIDRNIELVDDFYNKQFFEYDKRLKKLITIIANFNDVDNYNDDDELEEIIGVLLEIRTVFRNLKWFGELNKRGFIKILKKLDKKCGTCQQESFLNSRIYPLSFANEFEIVENLSSINKFLNELNPNVKKSNNSELNLISSDNFLRFIQKDDEIELFNQLNSQFNTIPTKLLISLLNKSAIYKSKNCIKKILDIIPSLSDPSDIYGRNFFHHHVFSLGKKIEKPSNNLNLSLIPIEPNLKLIDSFGPDGINSNDSIDSLLFILQNLPPHLRPCLLQKDNYKRTPLHYSSQYGLKGITEIIIEFLKSWNQWNSDVSIDDLKTWGDSESLSPLHLAILGSHPKTIEVLIKNSNFKLSSSKIFLLASRLNNPEILKILLNCQGIDINFIDEFSNNETALYIASKLNYTETVKFLLLNNADTAIKENSFGWTPIFIAAVEGLNEIVQLLKEFNADYCKIDDSGWTPMEHACLRGHLKIADHLKPDDKNYEILIKNSLNDYNSSKNSSNSSINEIRPVLSRDNSIEKVQQTNENKNNENKIKDELYKALKQQKKMDKVENKPVKQFGHRYLDKDESLIVVTLGSNDIRTTDPIIQLDRIPISKLHSTELDTALSLVISKKNIKENETNEDDSTVIDLPLDEVEPITFRSNYSKFNEEIIFFDIIPTYGGQDKNKKILGRAIVILNQIYTKVGTNRSSLNKLITLPIIETESLDFLGTISFEVLIVKPFEHPNLNINITNTYWKSLIQSRVIGHRGLGKNNNNKNSLQLGENTLESFIAASSLGASYVEFDVQLTKDSVPVVYHDFLVAESGVDIPMHDLTLEQFLNLNNPDSFEPAHSKDDDFIVLRSRPKSVSSQLNKVNEKMKLTRTFKEKGFKGNSRGDSIASSFVTLKELFKKIPKKVGFNIECKYPLLYEAQEEHIGETNIDLNHWCDTVLQIVFDNKGDRDVIFSSFHPEVCLMLSLKQPNIPILFLTESGSSVMPDVRTGSLQSAIRFCKKWNLLGIVSACEPIVKCPRLASVVKSSGLVCFTYGVQNNDPKNSKLQMDAGVDAVIVDNVLAVRKGLTNSTGNNNIDEVKRLVNDTEIMTI